LHAALVTGCACCAACLQGSKLATEAAKKQAEELELRVKLLSELQDKFEDLGARMWSLLQVTPALLQPHVQAAMHKQHIMMSPATMTWT
jgi:hypothetical protein